MNGEIFLKRTYINDNGFIRKDPICKKKICIFCLYWYINIKNIIAATRQRTILLKQMDSYYKGARRKNRYIDFNRVENYMKFKSLKRPGNLLSIFLKIFNLSLIFVKMNDLRCQGTYFNFFF